MSKTEKIKKSIFNTLYEKVIGEEKKLKAVN